MNQRPLSVTIIAGIFIAAGAVGLVYHSSEFAARPFHADIVWVSLVRLLAIIGGIFLLRGRNWARWLLLAWIAFHVVLSAFHSIPELAMHALLLAVFAYFLLRPKVSPYFQNAKAVPGSMPDTDP